MKNNKINEQQPNLKSSKKNNNNKNLRSYNPINQSNSSKVPVNENFCKVNNKSDKSGINLIDTKLKLIIKRS